MKKTKFNEEQIAMALYLADQTSVEEVTRKLGIAQVTFYRLIRAKVSYSDSNL